MPALNDVRRRINVNVRTLDAVVTEIAEERSAGPIYLKLDTQGFDLEVVKGAGQSIERVRALQTEVSIVPIYHGMTDCRASIETLTNYGFELSGLWAVNRDATLRAIEFDCVMVRPACCSTTGTPDPAGEGSDNAVG
jgi:hypothetical protein